MCAFSITKWVHLAHGDEGVLRPGDLTAYWLVCILAWSASPRRAVAFALAQARALLGGGAEMARIAVAAERLLAGASAGEKEKTLAKVQQQLGMTHFQRFIEDPR